MIQQILRIIGVVVFVFSFLAANVSIYAQLARPGSAVRLRPESYSIESVTWAAWSEDKQLCIADQIEVLFLVNLDCNNPEPSCATVKLNIDSIESEWKPSVDLSQVALKLQEPGFGSRTDGRLRLTEREGRDQRIMFMIPFASPNDRLDFASLDTLSQMDVIFVVDQPDCNRWTLRIPFDTEEVRKRMKNQLLKVAVGEIGQEHVRQRRGTFDQKMVEEHLRAVLEVAK